MDFDLALVSLCFFEPVITLSAELAVFFHNLLSILSFFDNDCASKTVYRCPVLAFSV